MIHRLQLYTVLRHFCSRNTNFSTPEVQYPVCLTHPPLFLIRVVRQPHLVHWGGVLSTLGVWHLGCQRGCQVFDKFRGCQQPSLTTPPGLIIRRKIILFSWNTHNSRVLVSAGLCVLCVHVCMYRYVCRYVCIVWACVRTCARVYIYIYMPYIYICR